MYTSVYVPPFPRTISGTTWTSPIFFSNVCQNADIYEKIGQRGGYTFSSSLAAKSDYLWCPHQPKEHLNYYRQQGPADGELNAQSSAQARCARTSKDLPSAFLLVTPHWVSLPSKLTVYLVQNLGLDYEERVLPSIGNEVLKAIVAQFDAAELITQREQVSARIRTDLVKRAKEFNIALEDVSITHMTFGKEFTKAVEQKQIAQQDAERARFIVEKAEQERQANVIRAEGEAESAETISRAIDKAGEGLLLIRKIEAAKEIAQTLAANSNVTYLPGGGSKDGGKSNLLLALR